MTASRRKISAVLGDFLRDIDRLVKFDLENQRAYSVGLENKNAKRLVKRQLIMLTESIFFSGFRAYENFIRDAFLLYCLEKRPESGKRVVSYLRPKSFQHAEELIQSSLQFLDWNTAETIIKRAELYLLDGFPVKTPYTSGKETFDELRLLRNHIAHRSKTSMNGYRKVLRRYFGTEPLELPEPGEYLLLTDKHERSKYKLLTYFDFLRQSAQYIA
jgi:hypothetical protein